MLPGLIPSISHSHFLANAVNFDGTNDYLVKSANLSGAADSKLLTGSVWLKAGADGTDGRVLNSTNTLAGTDSRIALIRSASNRFQITGTNAANSVILNVTSSANVIIVAAGWVHCLFSFDMSDTGKRHLYINDVSDRTDTTYTDDTIDNTVADWAIGARPSAANKFNGDMAELWLQLGLYIDFSIEANRRRFITAAKKPAYLGPTGARPTGSAPIIFLSGATASWETNKGTGGGFTENGALANASTSPSN